MYQLVMFLKKVLNKRYLLVITNLSLQVQCASYLEIVRIR